MKICSKCQISKPLSDFTVDARRKDGKNGLCKICIYSRRKERSDEYIKLVQDNPPVGKKKCSKCGIKKAVASFKKNKNNKDGLCYQCFDCMLPLQKKYKLINAEELAEYQKKYQKVYRKLDKKKTDT